MLSTKIRTALVTLIAVGGFATATVAPAASQAAGKTLAEKTPVAVTCEGTYKPGDMRTVTITVNKKVIVISTEICGSDGKFHEVKS